MCFVSEEVRVKAKVRKGKYVLRIQSENVSQKIKARQVKLKMWPRMLLGRRPMALKIPRRGPNSTNHSFISLEERLLTVGQKYFLQRDSVYMKNIFIYFILLYYLHLIMHVFQFDVCLIVLCVFIRVSVCLPVSMCFCINVYVCLIFISWHSVWHARCACQRVERSPITCWVLTPTVVSFLLLSSQLFSICFRLESASILTVFMFTPEAIVLPATEMEFYHITHSFDVASM